MRKYAICLLALGAANVHAADTSPMSISVESTRLSDVSGEEVKSADLAEALAKKVPSASLVRRSGIANDVILRGQKKDNINILIDDAKVYGACPNRMDPPTSHILTNNIEGIEIIEGPYDVENFGTLSGAVKITTKKPEKEMHGEVSVNMGSWGYQKAAATVTGGNDKVRLLASVSNEKSDQYEDGDGNDFSDQIQNAIDDGLAPASAQLQDKYKDQAAYQKRTFMGKAYIDISDNQELKLSYTANRSDDILYPSTPMDALYDNSDIINIDYNHANLGDYSKNLEVKYYSSKVDHPMSTYYRVAGAMGDMIHDLTTSTQGLKAINTIELSPLSQLKVGVDTSSRNWDGYYESNGPMGGPWTDRTSIDDVDTVNRALFTELEKQHAMTNVKVGIRYDDTKIETAGTTGQADNDYNSFSANIFANHKINDSTRLFGGIGKSHRVPDARELYLIAKNGTTEVGTPDLKQTSNTEIDLGVEKRYGNASVKAKVFYSMLKDYIYFKSNNPANKFVNIDATIYGVDISGDYFITDYVYLDYGYAMQVGEKDEALDGQTDKDLAEISPAKLTLALNYDYAANSTARVEAINAGKWDRYDGDNGEQEIDGYTVFNLKATHSFNKSWELTAGVDNATDETYAVSNTYKDLTLLNAGGDVMLMNEPGRYVYLNAAYRF